MQAQGAYQPYFSQKYKTNLNSSETKGKKKIDTRAQNYKTVYKWAK